MPSYSVWYRNNPEPLEFVTAYRCTETQIVDYILAHEQIAAPAAALSTPGLQDIIAHNTLAPVRYTEDESEMHTIA